MPPIHVAFRVLACRLRGRYCSRRPRQRRRFAAHYHANYSGAFVLVPGDHNIEAVRHEAECSVHLHFAAVRTPHQLGHASAHPDDLVAFEAGGRQ